MEARTFLISMGVAIVIVYAGFLILIRIDRVKRILPSPRKINQATFLAVLIIYMSLAQYVENPQVSLRELLVSTSTSPNLIALLPIFYFVLRACLKSPNSSLREAILGKMP